MNSRLYNRTRSLLATALLLLFGVYYTNTTLFYHQHLLGNTAIVHSHAYGGGHTQNANAHSDAQLQLVEQLSASLLAVGVSLLALLTVIRQLAGVACAVHSVPESLQSVSSHLLRAPPVKG